MKTGNQKTLGLTQRRPPSVTMTAPFMYPPAGLQSDTSSRGDSEIPRQKHPQSSNFTLHPWTLSGHIIPKLLPPLHRNISLLITLGTPCQLGRIQSRNNNVNPDLQIDKVSSQIPRQMCRCSFARRVCHRRLDLFRISRNTTHDDNLRTVACTGQMTFVSLVEKFEEGDTAKVDASDVGGEGVLEGLEGGFPEMGLESF